MGFVVAEHSGSADTFLEAEKLYITSGPAQGGMTSASSLPFPGRFNFTHGLIGPGHVGGRTGNVIMI